MLAVACLHIINLHKRLIFSTSYSSLCVHSAIILSCACFLPAFTLRFSSETLLELDDSQLNTNERRKHDSQLRESAIVIRDSVEVLMPPSTQRHFTNWTHYSETCGHVHSYEFSRLILTTLAQLRTIALVFRYTVTSFFCAFQLFSTLIFLIIHARHQRNMTHAQQLRDSQNVPAMFRVPRRLPEHIPAMCERSERPALVPQVPACPEKFKCLCKTFPAPERFRECPPPKQNQRNGKSPQAFSKNPAMPAQHTQAHTPPECKAPTKRNAVRLHFKGKS